MQPLLVGEFFGVLAFASVLGALQLGTQLASGLGPWAVGVAYDRLGGYERAFEALAVLAVAAGLVLSRVRAPQSSPSERA
jgi:cyanate permease